MCSDSLTRPGPSPSAPWARQTGGGSWSWGLYAQLPLTWGRGQGVLGEGGAEGTLLVSQRGRSKPAREGG